MEKVIDYTSEIAGTYFQSFDLLEGRGRVLRGLFKLSNPTVNCYGYLYDATLSQLCSHERDEAFVCVYADESIELTREEYEMFLNNGCFAEELVVLA